MAWAKMRREMRDVMTAVEMRSIHTSEAVISMGAVWWIQHGR